MSVELLLVLILIALIAGPEVASLYTVLFLAVIFLPGIVLYVIFAAQMFGPEIPGWVYYATIGAGVGVLILRRRARIERERLAMENMLEPPPPPCPHGEFYIQQLKERG
jgi:hypothetical protein